MALSLVLDTNVVLYHLGGRLATPLPVGNKVVSVVTEIELLSYPSLSPAEEASILAFLRLVQSVGLNDPVKQAAIQLRRTHRLRLPDAVIAATAVASGATLVTSDANFSNIPGLSVHQPALK